MRAVVVGGELGGEAVPRVRETGADRDEQARRTGAAAQPERRDGGGADDPEHEPEPDSAGVVDVAMRRGERQQRHAERHRGDGDGVGRPNGLGEPPRREREQEDEARPEQRLHDGQRRPGQRQRLQRPAHQPERRSRQPSRPADEAAEEGEPKRLVGRRRLRLARLQGDPDRVERGGRERGGDSRHDDRHG
jgi:hypothetical protein